ncbi:MAG: hypothetical protein LBP54_00495 [Campylobacteraceae bacterium]|jgi:hypothetical protein|nr:hypothetical protein [Campylobacteraceae bacterium]
MIRTLFLLAVFMPLFAEKIEFLETRYIEALNEKTVRAGEIEFEANKASIRYFPPHERKITLENNTVTTQTKDLIVQKSVKEEQNTAYMFIIFKAVFENDETELGKFFKITKEDADVVLTPLSTSAPVSKIIYSRDKDKIKKIEIFLWDDSRIIIDVVKKR